MRRLLAPLVGCALPLLAGCGGDPYPALECQQVVWQKPTTPGGILGLRGSWNDFGALTPFVPRSDGWWTATLSLAPGEYGYQILENGVARLDPYQPLTTYRRDEEISLLVAGQCTEPEIRDLAVSAGGDGSFSIRGTFVAAEGGPAVDPASVRATVDGAPASFVRAHADPATGALSFSAEHLAAGKHAVIVEARDGSGHRAEAHAAVWSSPAAAAWPDGLLYQIVVDRFRGDGGKALAPPPTPGSRAGGTLAGVTAEIERGTFDELGVSALWLSPVYTNPAGALQGRDGHLSEGYHGYWPAEPREVDPRLGGAAALDELIRAAHARGLRVLLDLVPNHVYEESPRFLEHGSDGWFNDGPGHCVCGDPGCDWGEHMQTCWFTSFLPDVRYQDATAMRAGHEDALFWMQRFDADGIRIDAVPMMPRSATRRIARSLRDSVAPRDALFVLGEVFTGPGEGGLEAIRYYMGPDGLDSAFDFPLMWALRDAVAHGTSGFQAVASTLDATDAALGGSGALPARILGNHDTSRFLSETTGEGGNDAWNHPPAQPTDPGAYARQRLALGLLLTLPGLPVLYYGDEVALAGASDPDCRRVMPAPDALSAEQAATLAFTKRLGALRRCDASLRTGARTTLVAQGDAFAFVRGASTVVVASKATAASSFTVPAGAVPPGDYADALTGKSYALPGAVDLDPVSIRVLYPTASPCR